MTNNNNHLQEQLRQLYELQSIDKDYMKIAQQEKEIPQKIEAFSRAIELEHKTIEDLEIKLDLYQKKRRELERELKIQEDSISNDRHKLMAVKTNKEYHAMQREIEAKKDKTGELEEQILRLMDESENFSREIRKAKERYEKAKSENEVEITKLRQLMEGIPTQLDAVKKDREQRMVNIKPELLDKYKGIRDKRHGVAVVQVDEGICNGCRMQIPPQLYNLVQRNEEVFTCPNCYRILFWAGTAKVHNLEEIGPKY